MPRPSLLRTGVLPDGAALRRRLSASRGRPGGLFDVRFDANRPGHRAGTNAPAVPPARPALAAPSRPSRENAPAAASARSAAACAKCAAQAPRTPPSATPARSRCRSRGCRPAGRGRLCVAAKHGNGVPASDTSPAAFAPSPAPDPASPAHPPRPRTTAGGDTRAAQRDGRRHPGRRRRRHRPAWPGRVSATPRAATTCRRRSGPGTAPRPSRIRRRWRGKGRCRAAATALPTPLRRRTCRSRGRRRRAARPGRRVPP